MGISKESVAVLEAEYAGVDIPEAESGGYYVNEVNGIPGWKGLQQITSVDIATRIVGHGMRSPGE